MKTVRDVGYGTGRRTMRGRREDVKGGRNLKGEKGREANREPGERLMG